MFEYYLFALFVFALICILVLLCNYLFADIKRQKKLLDEKESELLRLYRSVEELSEEFNDSIEQGRAEIAQSVERAEAAIARIMQHANQVETAPEVSRQRSAARKLTRPPSAADEEDASPADFRQILSGAGLQPDPVRVEPAHEVSPAQQGRHERILEMAGEGKTRAEIAQELNITQSEVALVIGINRK